MLSNIMPENRYPTHAPSRRDKYEKEKIEYWVEEETKGSYKVTSSEAWNDKREVDATEGMDLDGEKSEAEGTDDESDHDDEDSASSSSHETASTPHKKRRRTPSKKVKKSKKDKKEKKAKDKKKKKSKRCKSSASSKGSPKKEDLEEETKTEATSGKVVLPSYPLLVPASKAIDNAAEVMQQLLRVQAKVEVCAGKLEQLSGPKAEACFGRRGFWCSVVVCLGVVAHWNVQPRSLETVYEYSTRLSEFHDQLADIRASHAGSKKSFCDKPLASTTLGYCIRAKTMKPIITDVPCGHF